MRKKLFIILSTLLALCTFTLAACKDVPVNGEYDLNAGVTGVRGDVEFTVVSYNLCSHAATEESVKGAQAQIASVGADVAGLQEVDRDGSDRADGNMVSNLTSGDMKSYFFAPTMSYYFGDKYGIMTTTRHTLDSSFSLFLPFPYEHMTLSNASMEPRVVTRSLITIDGVQIAAYNTHLDYTGEVMPDGTVVRLAQMRFIYDLMNSDPCPYKVLSGDFNVADMDEFSVFGESGKYAMLVTPSNPLPTFRSGDGKESSIDNIIYTSDTMELTKGGVTRSDYSDHFMLYATFKTK